MSFAKDIAAGMVRLFLNLNQETSILDIYRIRVWCIFVPKQNMSPFQAYLHSMNVIHRDLNSYNCLVREVNILLFISLRRSNSLSRTHINDTVVVNACFGIFSLISFLP